MFLSPFLYVIAMTLQGDYIFDRDRKPLTDIEITPLEAIMLILILGFIIGSVMTYFERDKD
ncbi:hypothetical protein [Dokdonia sp.]|uniref:hypothetical protein n=1 Tax=Dokdonia sp. TaxID=2024995 RepID=UPI0032667DE8